MTHKDTSELRFFLTRELMRLEQHCSISAVESCPDEADLAAQVTQRRMEMALADRQQTKRDQLKDALHRLDIGDFGVCDECDGDIPVARLRANPTARLCVRCQEEFERQRNVAA